MIVSLLQGGHIVTHTGERINLDANKRAILIDTTKEGPDRTESLNPELIEGGIEASAVSVSVQKSGAPYNVFQIVNQTTFAAAATV